LNKKMIIINSIYTFVKNRILLKCVINPVNMEEDFEEKYDNFRDNAAAL